MASSTQVDTQALALAGRQARPLWFDGRFLAARDLERDQSRFLQRQAALGRAAGFGVIHGLLVDRVSVGGEPDAETIVIHAGQGITPDGGLVMISTDLTVRISDLAEEESLEVQFGISRQPATVARTRTGLYVVALRPVQFTANPIASYPSSLQSAPALHDGDIVEATAVSLVPYPVPASNYAAATRNAAVARQIFVAGEAGPQSASLLPVAMISLQDGAIEWLDCYLVRRDSGPEFGGLRFGLADPPAQQAFLLQYDAQLRQAVAAFKTAPASFAATDYFQALPPAGCFPLASIDVRNLTQLFFPQQTDVRLSLVAEDEIPALIEDSLSLPPIDLTLAASAYADLAVFALVPVSRASYATLAASLQPVALSGAVPQAVNYRATIDLLRFYPPKLGAATSGNTWQQAIGSTTYGYYIRRRSVPIYVSAAAATVPSATSLTAAPIATSPIATSPTAFQLSATVSPSTAVGTVTFKDGARTLGTVDLTAGTATLAVPPFAAGAHALTAVYNSDANFAASTATLTLNVAATNLTVAPTAGSPRAFTLTATVAPATASGRVTFMDGTRALGTVNLAAGAATLAVPPFAAGAHALTAVYSGDANFAPSISATAILAATATSLSVAPASGTGAFTLTATVSPSTATGTVTFMDGASVLGTAAVAAGAATLASTLATGTHALTAVYNGSAAFAASASASVSQTV
ncbi:MAG TPA: Ig-like domain-containing protein [Xanthobacteraceae bacterium]|nr:Ig-like domain-containing protein [Xanthobacteraceae bacterium]